MKKHNGFTLIELLIVIVIVGLLAVAALPSYTNYIHTTAMGNLITVQYKPIGSIEVNCTDTECVAGFYIDTDSKMQEETRSIKEVKEFEENYRP